MALLGAFIYFYLVRIPKNQVFGFAVAIGGVLVNAFSSILGRDVNRSGDLDPLTVTLMSMEVGSIVLLITRIAIDSFSRNDETDMSRVFHP